MSKLPNGWGSATLAEVASWGSGGTPQAGNSDYYGGHIPWAVIGDLTDGPLQSTSSSITAKGLAESSAKIVPPGSVLIAMYGSIGKLGLPEIELATNQAVAFATPKPDVMDRRFLFWYLMSERDALTRSGKGATQQNISQSILKSWPAPVPPLDEQRRIVSILEDHLSRLAHGRNAIKAFAPKAAHFTRSMLLNLVLGGGGGQADQLRLRLAGRSLVLAVADTDWGGVGEPRIPLPSEWRWQKWHEVGSSQNGKGVPSADYTDAGVRLLRPGNLKSDGTLSWTDKNTKYLPDNYRESHAGLLLADGDIVMNLTAQSLKDDFLGRACLVQEGDEAVLNQRLARLVSHLCKPEYALMVLRSPLFRTYVRSLNTGSLIQHMYTKQLAEFWFPVPPMEVQRRIVDQANEMFGWLELATHAAHRAERLCDALERSLLESAFSGHLAKETARV